MAIDVRTQSQELIAVVRSDQFVEQLSLALPETVSPRRFARIATTAIQQNPDLALCTRDSVFQALLRCAADGLLPDGRQAAITKFRNKKKGVDEATYMPMIDGLRHTAAEYGWALRTAVVYANDEFAYTDEPPALAHRSVKPGEARGDLVATYAVATHKDGRRIQMVLHPADVAKRRAISKRPEIWEQWPERMWEKSSGRAIFRQLPLSERDMERVAHILAADDAFEQALSDPVAALYGREAVVVPRGAERPAPDVQDNDDTGAGRASSSDGGVATTPAGTEESEAEDGVWEEAAQPEFTDEQIAAAGATVIPAGVHKDKTLAQVVQEDDGASWLLAQLKKVPLDNPARLAIETIVKTQLPETWQRYQRWLETQAA